MKSRAPSSAEQDYLEAIEELIERKGYAKVVEIAERLNLKGSSVTRMIQKLARNGFLKYEKYRGITMTEAGRRTAIEMKQCHQLLRNFLITVGVDPKTADDDAEGMEHHVSKKTLACLEKWLEKRARPERSRRA
jgi:Mn-dependent DtxR family transcriptional regulator